MVKKLKAAVNSNLKPKEFVDKLSLNFINLIPFLGCEINDFIRTTLKIGILKHLNYGTT